MRILVTGASGFVGREFCKLAAERNHVLRGLTRRKMPDLPFECVQADLETQPDLGDALKDIEVVVHLAARVHKMHEDSADPEAAYREANLEVTRHLVEQAITAGVKRFVFVSSIKASGEHSAGRALTEDDRPAPQDPYGRSKLEAEKALQALAEASSMEWIIVRPVLVYGAGVGGNFLRLMKLVRSRLPLPFGCVNTQRSFINVWNLADLLECCCTHPAAANQLFLAADSDFGTAGLICALARAMKISPRLLPIPLVLLRLLGLLPGARAALGRLNGELLVSADKAHRLLGWQPRVSPEEALNRTVEHFSTSSRN